MYKFCLCCFQILKAEYLIILERLDGLEQQEVIGAFDKWTIIEFSRDVIKEIAQECENVQKGVGGMMSGALIETKARTILNQGIKQGKVKTGSLYVSAYGLGCLWTLKWSLSVK